MSFHGTPGPPQFVTFPFPCPKFPCQTRPHSRAAVFRRMLKPSVRRLRLLLLPSLRASDLGGVLLRATTLGAGPQNTAEIGRAQSGAGRLRTPLWLRLRRSVVHSTFSTAWTRLSGPAGESFWSVASWPRSAPITNRTRTKIARLNTAAINHVRASDPVARCIQPRMPRLS